MPGITVIDLDGTTRVWPDYDQPEWPSFRQKAEPPAAYREWQRTDERDAEGRPIYREVVVG